MIVCFIKGETLVISFLLLHILGLFLTGRFSGFSTRTTNAVLSRRLRWIAFLLFRCKNIPLVACIVSIVSFVADDLRWNLGRCKIHRFGLLIDRLSLTYLFDVSLICYLLMEINLVLDFFNSHLLLLTLYHELNSPYLFHLLQFVMFLQCFCNIVVWCFKCVSQWSR